MKIQCDVCEKEEASVFCTADEASLCDGCDRRVHHANKLASKHPRFSLLHPSFQHSPRCDICQEKGAFVFCKEDRAILCRECDICIHKANEHTQKHNRFLLTGVKLSASASTYDSSNQTPSYSNASSTTAQETDAKGTDSKDIYTPPPSDSDSASASASASVERTRDHSMSMSMSTSDKEDSIPTGTISEYLMETLPGWHLDDFLDPSHPYGFCKAYDGTTPPFDPESYAPSFSTEDMEIWTSPSINLSPQYFSSIKKTNRGKWIEQLQEEQCTVPFITPSSIPRQLW